MNCCTQLDDIMQEHVSQQQLETQKISRSQIEGEGHTTGYSNYLPLRDREKLVRTVTHEPLHLA